MKGLNIPRHLAHQPYGWAEAAYSETISFPIKMVQSPYTVKMKDITVTCQNHYFKRAVVQSDRVKATDYGRISFYSRMGTSKYDWAVGGYEAKNVTQYIAPIYARSSSPLFSSTYLSSVTIRSDFNDEQRAIAQCLAKFASDDLQINSTLAEAKETAGYLGEATLKLFLGAKAIVTGNKKQLKQLFNNSKNALTHARLDLMHNRSAAAKRLAKGVGRIPRSVGSRFLEYKFAIAPLVMDVEGLRSLMREGLTTAEFDDKPWLLSASSAVVTDINSDWVPATNVKCSINAKRIHYVKAVVSVNNAPLYAVAAIGGNNVAGGFWEATKFSWLVDYALPIGTFLTALHATQGLEFQYGYKGVAISGFVLERTKFQYEYGSPAMYAFSGFERNTLTSFPVVVPYTKSPFTSNNLQAILALAAVLNPFGSKKKLF